MVNCRDMKLGDVYTCEDCGLELKVVKECEDTGTGAEECACTTACGFECCGSPLTPKES
jgi:hypothetical protein